MIDIIGPIVRQMDAEYRSAGLIDTTPLATVLENRASTPTVLSFPGKVLAEPDAVFEGEFTFDRLQVGLTARPGSTMEFDNLRIGTRLKDVHP